MIAQAKETTVTANQLEHSLLLLNETADATIAKLAEVQKAAADAAAALNQVVELMTIVQTQG